VGKSFLSANLAHVLASAGKRVLLLDCDLRRGQLHRYLGTKRGVGLSEVLSGQCQLPEATRKTALENLDFISTGRLPPNPSEMIASPRFQAFLDDVSAKYDLTVIDLPPILAVTDAALGARHAGVNLLLLRSGKHPMREIVLALRHFANAGVTIQGVVLNGISATSGRYSRYSHQHHYQYAYHRDPKDQA
jgi:tyrosine-protein kinase Etk/Wzc